MELKTIEFIKQHQDWKELLTSAPYNLIINEDDKYCLLRYNQIDSDFTEDIVKECRGLIIDKQTLEPKALSFKKFFNVQEPNADRIQWRSARVQEKVDGSKILVWHSDEGWRISTSGIIDAFTANVSDFGITFGDLFKEALSNNSARFHKEKGIIVGYDIRVLDPNKCYTFELVSPKSRVVIPYNKTTIYLTGIRDVITFEELDPRDDDMSICNYFKTPKQFELKSLSACLEAAERMGYDEEGFVVVDKYWNRIKIKSPAYVIAHYCRNNNVQSMSRLLEVVERNEVDEFLAYCPEWEEQIKDLQYKLFQVKQEIRLGINSLKGVHKDPDLNRKSIAKFILDYFGNVSSFLFKYLDVDLDGMFIEVEWNKLTSDQKLKRLGIKDNGQREDS